MTLTIEERTYLERTARRLSETLGVRVSVADVQHALLALAMGEERVLDAHELDIARSAFRREIRRTVSPRRQLDDLEIAHGVGLLRE